MGTGDVKGNLSGAWVEVPCYETEIPIKIKKRFFKADLAGWLSG